MANRQDGGFLRDSVTGALVVSGIGQTTLASSKGVKADGVTLTDGVLSGNQLSSAGTQFAQADVGKLAVVPGAGTPVATTLSSGLTSGTPTSTLTVAALPSALPAGGIVLDDGAGHTQKMVTTGAASGATSIPLAVSTTPNFSYLSGVSVKSMTPALSTTIQSVAGGVATLAASAGTNIASAAEVFYATDDTVAAQATIDAAGLVGGVAEFPTGHIGLSAALSSTASLTIRGQGIIENLGPVAGGFDALSFPTVPPYLGGTVFVQCAASTDALRLSAVGLSQNVEKFGVRFAGKFVNTGHGISTANLPVSGTGLDQGPMVSSWRDITVFGQDGNHYGFDVWNCMYHRHDNLHAYGGGGYQFAQNTQTVFYGNLTATRIFANTFVAGSAHAMFLNNSRGSGIDYCQFFHPQLWLMDPTGGSGGIQPPNTVAPTIAQKLLEYSGAMHHMGFVGADCETTQAGAIVNRPPGRGNYWIGHDFTSSTVLGGTNNMGTPTTGTNLQNLTGQQQFARNPFLLTPAAAASASTTLSVAAAFPNTTLTVTSATGFAAGQGIQIDIGGTIPEYRIIQSVAGSVLTLTTPVFHSHAIGATVEAGAAVVMGQVATASIANTVANGNSLYEIAAAAIGEKAKMVPIGLLVPSNWFMRIDWANAQREGTLYQEAPR